MPDDPRERARPSAPARSAGRAAAALAVACLLAGCTSVTRVFPDREPEQVWTALVGVAQTPSYESPDPTRRWRVEANDVLADDRQQTIRIHRTLRREVHRPLTRPVEQERTWKLEVRLDAADPPQATLISHGLNVPALAREEADRYFAQVAAVLGTSAEPARASFDQWVDSFGTDADAAPPPHRVYDD